MIKSKQVLTLTDVDSIYCGWSNQIEVSGDGFECSIELNEELLLRLADKLADKAKEVREKRLEEARETLEALNESTETAD